MSKTHPPELKKYMDKQINFKLNGNRNVSGILRGFDPFMNIVVEDAVEHLKWPITTNWNGRNPGEFDRYNGTAGANWVMAEQKIKIVPIPTKS